jgi:hypothetical protein
MSNNNSHAIAGLRIHRNHVAKMISQTTNRVAKRALVEALAQIDATLPVKAAKPAQAGSRHVAALRAHRTMQLAKLPGTRGKVRAEIKAKIDNYDQQIAA